MSLKNEVCSIGECQNSSYYRLILRESVTNRNIATIYSMCKEHGDELLKTGGG